MIENDDTSIPQLESQEEDIKVKCSSQEVINCMFHKWYDLFKPVTFKSSIIHLPNEFVEYLEEDGIVMDDHIFPVKPEKQGRYDELDDKWDENENDESLKVRSFPDLESKIKEIIEDLEGSVFPKLNWSAPKDATWMATDGTLKCTSPAEVLLLLKSSENIAHDLERAFENCSDNTLSRPPEFVLVLRKYYQMKPSMEFRCFVRNNQLIGISQRDCTNYYSFLKEKSKEIQQKISEFFDTKIKGKFFDSNYIFDVYISSKRVVLIDFNPWNSRTESLLFSWNELVNEAFGSVDFRYITSQSGITPSASMQSRLPYDLAHFSSGSISDLIQMMKEQEKLQD